MENIDHFLFIAFPLKINDGDGSPCRAVVIEDFRNEERTYI